MVFLPRDYAPEYQPDYEPQMVDGGHAPLPESMPIPVRPGSPDIGAHLAAEARRRATGKVHVPSNILCGSITGSSTPHSDWRDAIDAVASATITPAAANGSASVTVAFITWSAAAQALFMAPDAGRFVLVVRTFTGAPAALTATGVLVWTLQTSGGDILPLGAYSAAGAINLGNAALAGPAGIASDPNAAHLLIVSSAGVTGPVAVTVQLGVSLMVVRRHNTLRD